jgi:hypothetical protein
VPLVVVAAVLQTLGPLPMDRTEALAAVKGMEEAVEL